MSECVCVLMFYRFVIYIDVFLIHITRVEELNMLVTVLFSSQSGKREVYRLDLEPARHGYNSAYDPNINPGTLNSFTTGAFRSFHSLIQGTLQ